MSDSKKKYYKIDRVSPLEDNDDSETVIMDEPSIDPIIYIDPEKPINFTSNLWSKKIRLTNNKLRIVLKELQNGQIKLEDCKSVKIQSKKKKKRDNYSNPSQNSARKTSELNISDIKQEYIERGSRTPDPSKNKDSEEDSNEVTNSTTAESIKKPEVVHFESKIKCDYLKYSKRNKNKLSSRKIFRILRGTGSEERKSQPEFLGKPMYSPKQRKEGFEKLIFSLIDEAIEKKVLNDIPGSIFEKTQAESLWDQLNRKINLLKENSFEFVKLTASLLS